jgi:hypothetical protein
MQLSLLSCFMGQYRREMVLFDLQYPSYRDYKKGVKIFEDFFSTNLVWYAKSFSLNKRMFKNIPNVFSKKSLV